MSSLALLLLPALLRPSPIEERLLEIQAQSKGAVGAAIITPTSSHYLRRHERFSLQSVMKMMVGMAAMDQVDQGKWRLDQKFTFRQSDLSVSHQPIKDILGKRASMQISLADCIELMVTNSCSGAADFIIRELGGPQVVTAFLRKKGIHDMRVDRQERDLQTQISGLKWKLAYADEKVFDADEARLSQAARDAAYARYQADPRDTTTPDAMGRLLTKLVTGKLLSPRSTQTFISVMERTKTGPDRLRAGVKEGWTLGNKTGTSSTHRGVAGATNDVGFVRNAKGDWIVIVALLRNSRHAPAERAGILRQVAETAFWAR